MLLDHDWCYRAASSRDPRFDGVFFTAVHTTGIYCRPSCPAVQPKRRNCTFYPTAAAAHAAGYRACKRCRPDTTPGSPEWDVRGDVVGRAMRMIRDGLVDREGVSGLASRLGYSERQLQRLLKDEVGAGPLSLARSQRAQTARLLVETTALSMTDIAFAAGFSSVRQFNDTIRVVYATTPSVLRASRKTTSPEATHVRVRLAVRQPFDFAGLWAFLTSHLVDGLEWVDGDAYARTLDLPGGAVVVRLTPHADHVDCTVELTDLADLGTAIARCRALLDLDADPVAVAETLAASGAMTALLAARPGVRVPGAVDGFELAARTVIGQQVSLAGANTTTARIVRIYGREAGDRWLFPTPEALAAADPARLGMPASRGRAVVALAATVTDGLQLDAGADREQTRAELLALPGIGRWTADYVAMRALRDTDVLLDSDLVIRRAMADVGVEPGSDDQKAWSPWRSYATLHLWRHALTTMKGHA